VAQGFPLTLSLSKGERKTFFNGTSGGAVASVAVVCGVARPAEERMRKAVSAG
jgi:hypothetical protein